MKRVPSDQFQSYDSTIRYYTIIVFGSRLYLFSLMVSFFQSINVFGYLKLIESRLDHTKKSNRKLKQDRAERKMSFCTELIMYLPFQTKH